MVRWYGGTAVRQEKHERYLFIIIFFSNFVGENEGSHEKNIFSLFRFASAGRDVPIMIR